MMSNNKILTVSYGTFSCTLEGFDDSFGTMKAIAEYFRDLASEDRYFGAEPPQPDAEMLARIAEKEIARRVEAHLEDGGVVLRAGAAGPAALAAGVAVAGAELEEASAADTEDSADDEPVEVAEMEDHASELIDAASNDALDDGDVSADAELDPDMSDDEPMDEDVSPEEPIAQTAAEEETLDDTDSLIASYADAADTADEEPLVLETPNEPTENFDEDAAESFFANASDDDDVEGYDDAAESGMMNGSAAVAPSADSIAAKLQRIRDVVSRNETDDAAPYSEDEHAEELSDGDDVEDDANDIAQPSSTAFANMGWGIELNQHDSDAEMEDDQADDGDDLSAMLRETVAGSDTETLADDASEGEQDADENLFSEADAEVAPVPAPPIARVVRVKRADVLPEPVEEPEPETAEDTSELSAEDEADLMRELAEVEAEVDPETAMGADASLDDDFSSISDDEFEAELEQETQDALSELDDEDDATAANRLREASGTEDEALDRLMAEAEHQLDEPEGTSRRAAFSHLRAAVAAKIADAGLGKKDEAETTEAYRNDLADAVKPRRPVASEARSERPAQRPAPLKLVAEQRIDGEQANQGPVRPRRVATGLDITDASDFAEYASDRGASELPELLEAAASYLSFVEGLDQFSRPQLMTKVRQVEKENFSREDGLRSFGQLLREGKIEKIKGGRFTVSDDIGYRPDGERAAG